MRKCQRFLLAVLVLFSALSISSNTLCAEPIKIKGFFIGMSIDDALKNFERLGFDGLKIQESKLKQKNKYDVIRPGSGDPFKVQTGLNVKSVSLVYFSSGISNRLFHTRGINAEIFKSSFMKAYDIQKMKPYRDNPGSDNIKGWEHYNLKYGYRIRIYLDKSVEMIETARGTDFTFD